jgi:hypothetical protein
MGSYGSSYDSLMGVFVWLYFVKKGTDSLGARGGI